MADDDFRKLNLPIPIKFIVILIIVFILIIVLIYFLFLQGSKKESEEKIMDQQEIILPQPQKSSNTSIEESLLKRRSIREYKDEPLTITEISQILWAAQGITAPESGSRTAPSAGALYPLEVYLIVRKVENFEPAVYKYLPKDHKLNKILKSDISGELIKVAQDFVSQAPAILVFSGVFERTTQKYGERGIRYVYMEAGHAAQNVYLQAQSLGLGTVTVGAFSDEEFKKILNLPEEETPLYIMPIGKIK